MAFKDAIKRALANKNDSVVLGDRTVEVKKLTWNIYKRFSSSISLLPNAIMISFQSYQEDNLQNVILAALEACGDEIYEIVAAITEIDIEYLKEEVGIVEILEYVILLKKKNDLSGIVKNEASSLLPKLFPKKK